MDEKKVDFTMLERAEAIRAKTPVPTFTPEEQTILLRFFSNIDKNTFFLSGLPEELTATLMSMYSRIKNPRGLRGIFVEDFIKEIPAVTLLGFDPQAKRDAVSSDRIKKFLSTWLDKYGHNSIARMGAVHVCFERVSVMAAKCVEEGRPGAGYLELSTRYVDMSKAGLYPIGELLGDKRADDLVMGMLNNYAKFHESERENFVRLAKILDIDEPTDVQLNGKLGDHVGNMLPCCVLTSVGATVSGEAFQRLASHLMRENDPECEVLAEEMLDEAKRTGADVLLGNHYEPTEYERIAREDYLEVLSPVEMPVLEDFHAPKIMESEALFLASLRQGSHPGGMREPFQKANRTFEMGSATFSGMMSFRSWRDLHRQGMCTHWRSLVKPGWAYTPPDMTLEYCKAANDDFIKCRVLYDELLPIDCSNEVVLQKICPMGAYIRYRVHANLRQMEFMIWQRSKYAVHHEVRKHILAMNQALCDNIKWWKDVTRAKKGEYFFARGPELPPIDGKTLVEKARKPWMA